MEDLRYPIGRFTAEKDPIRERVQGWIDTIDRLPGQLRKAVDGLSEEQLDTPYRPGGWTVRQVVHHLADSHINSYVRFRLALTEESPLIKTYDEKAWASLPDASRGPIDVSLNLLENLHWRWVALLRALSQTQFERTFRHPELGQLNLAVTTQLYAWHCEHHLAHITGLAKRQGFQL